MAVRTDGDYWNHNTAYHPWLIEIAARHRGNVLDVGCGDGLLAQRLASVSRSVTAIDPDAAAIQRATDRLASHQHVAVSCESFDTFQTGRKFDLITFVASLHHMDLRASLVKARDWFWAVAVVPAARLGSWAHSETRDVGVVVTDPSEGIDDIRRAADDVLPGASVRRALYYRYLLRWANDSANTT